jgi:4-hydroxy-tetrahydrodipicolinate synthase
MGGEDAVSMFEGVFCIVSTPFLPDEELDLESLDRLIRAALDAGVHGVTVLGVAGEANRLGEAEAELVVERAVAVAAGRVPVVVGVSQNGTRTTVEAARRAERLGAAAVMCAPPTFQQAGPALTEHFAALGRAVGVPIVLQDYPPINGVTLGPSQLAQLVADVPSIAAVKLEGVPTPPRCAQLLAAVHRPFTVVGGLSGVYLLDELRRGARGSMTGYPYPEALVAIWRAWSQGDRRRAAELHARQLPLMVLDGQPGVGLALRKAVLRHRGLIAHATVRRPGPTLDEGDHEALMETLAAVCA